MFSFFLVGGGGLIGGLDWSHCQMPILVLTVYETVVSPKEMHKLQLKPTHFITVQICSDMIHMSALIKQKSQANSSDSHAEVESSCVNPRAPTCLSMLNTTKPLGDWSDDQDALEGKVCCFLQKCVETCMMREQSTHTVRLSSCLLEGDRAKSKWQLWSLKVV